MLEQLNGKASTLTAAKVSAQFAPSFLAQLQADQLIRTLQQIAAAGPYDLAQYTPTPDGTGAEALLTGARVAFKVFINVEPAAPNLISGLLFRATSNASTWTEIDAAMSGLVSERSLFAAEVTDGRCQPVHALNATQPFAIASSFKLYVLGELATQIGAGKASWDEQLAIRDEWKSLPSGTMQNDPDGTTHTILEYARQMISISDNTAADHLIHRLGREQVEGNLPAMGLADPARDIPFPYTRDLFLLKATKNAALKQQYLAAAASGRRELLDGQVAATPLGILDYLDWSSPRDIDTLEWFASTSDLCAAMSKLRDLGGQPGLSQVLDILSINPGKQVDRSTWPYVGYKGGSEPGVLQLTWLLRRADDRWFVVSLTLDDPNSEADNTLAGLGVAGDAMDLLAAAP